MGVAVGTVAGVRGGEGVVTATVAVRVGVRVGVVILAGTEVSVEVGRVAARVGE